MSYEAIDDTGRIVQARKRHRRGANDGSDAKMKTPELREGYRDGNYRVGHK